MRMCGRVGRAVNPLDIPQGRAEGEFRVRTRKLRRKKVERFKHLHVYTRNVSVRYETFKRSDV